VTAGLTLDLNVVSQNYIDWTVQSVDANIIDPTTGDALGTGTIGEFTILKRSNTTVSMPVDILVDLGAVGSTVVSELEKCVTKGGSLSIEVDLVISLAGLSWLRKPTITENANVPC